MIHRKMLLAIVEIPDDEINENSLILEEIIANFITAIQRVFLKMHCVHVLSYLLCWSFQPS